MRICRTSVELVRRWDREHVLRVVPFQDAVAVARFPIALPALAAAMHLVLPDGRVYAGADAIPELLRLFPEALVGAAVSDSRRVAARAPDIPQIAVRRHCLVRGIPGR